MRVVEREVARRWLLHGKTVVDAGEVLVEEELLSLAVRRDHEDQSCGHLGRGLDRLAQAAGGVGIDHDPVHVDLDVVLLVLVQRNLLGQLVEITVDPGPAEACLARVGQDVVMLALASADDRCHDAHPAAPGQLEDPVGDLLAGLAADDRAVDRAVRDPDPGPQQAHVVVDLGHGTHGRPGVVARSLLVDRDRRRQAVDLVHVRLLHLAQELAGVGGKRLDVAALALGVYGVEGERRLARSGQPGEDHQLVPGNGQVDVPEVVLAGAPDHDVGVLRRPRRAGAASSLRHGLSFFPCSATGQTRTRPRRPAEATGGTPWRRDAARPAGPAAPPRARTAGRGQPSSSPSPGP